MTIRPDSPDRLGAPERLGYCTNVHAGVDLDSIRKNLAEIAVPVQASVAGDEPLGVGLWLPATAAAELHGSTVSGFASFLTERRLRPFTVNGFPYDNFHQEVVKHRVYLPAWWDPRRLDYTRRLATILEGLLPPSETLGSISTLPIGWPDNPLARDETVTDQRLETAAANLRSVADDLAEIESRTGRRIVLAIEPEPGCVLDTADDVIDWFERHLPETRHRRYLTVCHDICHAAVMDESQSDVLRRYAAAGIGVGKVQVSSAIVADWEAMAIGRRREAVEQLRAFAEDRYLHQTGCVTDSGGFRLFGDLPERLATLASEGDPVEGDRRWVVHFHVPVFLERFGHLATSQRDVLECLLTLADPQVSLDFTGHLEVETYAWTVLPESMRRKGLAEDIAGEIRWLRRALLEVAEA